MHNFLTFCLTFFCYEVCISNELTSYNMQLQLIALETVTLKKSFIEKTYLKLKKTIDYGIY